MNDTNNEQITNNNETKHKSVGVNRTSLIIMTILMCAIGGVITVAIIYYSFFHIDNVIPEEKDFSPILTINDDRLNLLLDHLSILDPTINHNSLVTENDITDEDKLAIATEELMYEKEYEIEKVEGVDPKSLESEKIIINIDKLLAKILALFNLKEYDKYPDSFTYRNINFYKEGNQYVGTRTSTDEDYGKYVYTSINYTLNGNELYLEAELAYYESSDGSYTDSTRDMIICSGYQCVDKTNEAVIHYRPIHGTYQIVNNNYVLKVVSIDE